MTICRILMNRERKKKNLDGYNKRYTIFYHDYL